MLTIDGAYHEGGGQIIRTSVALSALTGNPVRIINIRAKRCNPGLQAQHVVGILSLAKLCGAKTTGVEIGSNAVEFIPKEIKGGEYSVDVGTAGSIPLVLQTLILPAIHAKEPVNFEISGGTDVKWSPTIDYTKHIFFYFLEKMGADVKIDILKRGFYPKGGGAVKAAIKPAKMARLELANSGHRGEKCKIRIWSAASECLKNARVAERQADGANRIFQGIMAAGNITERTIEYAQSLSAGSSILIQADYENCRLGATALGELYKPAEKVGEEAALLLEKQMRSGACLDEWMADQIVPYLALFGGSVKVAEITPHAETNMWVVEQFLNIKFNADKERHIIAIKS